MKKYREHKRFKREYIPVIIAFLILIGLVTSLVLVIKNKKTDFEVKIDEKIEDTDEIAVDTKNTKCNNELSDKLKTSAKNVNISSRALVSDISGILHIVTFLSDSIEAGIRATAAFLAPLILIVPVNSFPPFIISFFIFVLLCYAIIIYSSSSFLTFSSPLLIIFLGSYSFLFNLYFSLHLLSLALIFLLTYHLPPNCFYTTTYYL